MNICLVMQGAQPSDVYYLGTLCIRKQASLLDWTRRLRSILMIVEVKVVHDGGEFLIHTARKDSGYL